MLRLRSFLSVQASCSYRVDCRGPIVAIILLMFSISMSKFASIYSSFASKVSSSSSFSSSTKATAFLMTLPYAVWKLLYRAIVTLFSLTADRFPVTLLPGTPLSNFGWLLFMSRDISL